MDDSFMYYIWYKFVLSTWGVNSLLSRFDYWSVDQFYIKISEYNRRAILYPLHDILGKLVRRKHQRLVGMAWTRESLHSKAWYEKSFKMLFIAFYPKSIQSFSVIFPNRNSGIIQSERISDLLYWKSVNWRYRRMVLIRLRPAPCRLVRHFPVKLLNSVEKCIPGHDLFVM